MPSAFNDESTPNDQSVDMQPHADTVAAYLAGQGIAPPGWGAAPAGDASGQAACIGVHLHALALNRVRFRTVRCDSEQAAACAALTIAMRDNDLAAPRHGTALASPHRATLPPAERGRSHVVSK